MILAQYNAFGREYLTPRRVLVLSDGLHATQGTIDGNCQDKIVVYLKFASGQSFIAEQLSLTLDCCSFPASFNATTLRNQQYCSSAHVL